MERWTIGFNADQPLNFVLFVRQNFVMLIMQIDMENKGKEVVPAMEKALKW